MVRAKKESSVLAFGMRFAGAKITRLGWLSRLEVCAWFWKKEIVSEVSFGEGRDIVVVLRASS